MEAVQTSGAPSGAATNTTNGTLVWTAHPVIDVIEGGRYRALSDAEIQGLLAAGTPAEAVEAYWQEREARIRRSVDDPLRHGFELPWWAEVRALLARKAEVYALGGNNPGKTEIGGKLAVEALLAKPGAKVLCVTLHDDYSKLQMASVYKYLPASARGQNERAGPRKRDVVKNVTYSQKSGFTEGTFVLPNRAQCWFKTVEQYLRNPTGFEGPQYDFVWLDEPVPKGLLGTLKYRAGKLDGKIFHTFTAVNGYDATCAEVLTGAKLLKSLPMNWRWALEQSGMRNAECGNQQGFSDAKLKIPELSLDEVQVKDLPAGHMPYLMQPLDFTQGVIFLWTHWNPFQPASKLDANLPAISDKVRGKGKRNARMRLFGWAEKLSGCQFPTFNPNVHVIEHAKIAEMLKGKKLTGYLAGDPATARSYFLLWLGVDRLGRMFIYDESPQVAEGEWVTVDGEIGDGARLYGGKGVSFYKQYIRAREREHGMAALRRFGDPRAFATEAAAAGGGRSLFELFNDEEGEKAETDELAAMYWEPAKVMRSLAAEAACGSLDKINDAFSYDTEKPISVENEPKLYISDRCENLIRALLNWDPAQGEKSPYKDPVDVLRYLFGEQPYYSDPDIPEVVGGRGWGARR